MVLLLSEASKADVQYLAPVAYAAFHTNDPANLSSAFFRHSTVEEVMAWRVQPISASFDDGSSRCARITDFEEGRIVAYARFGLPHPSPAVKDGQDGYRQLIRAALPKGANLLLMKAFDAAMDEKRALYMDEGRDYILRGIATHPDYQRQGCASMLIQWGLDLADAENAQVYLEATPAGKDLYRRFGFEEIDEIVFDRADYRESGVQTTTMMMRPSSPKTIQ